MNRTSAPMGPLLTSVAAFALGAAATWLVVAAVDNWKQEPKPVKDDVLRERVRARVGELTNRPIEVQVADGVVRLSGEMPAQERDTLLSAVTGIPGVLRVRNALGSMREAA